MDRWNDEYVGFGTENGLRLFNILVKSAKQNANRGDPVLHCLSIHCVLVLESSDLGHSGKV